MEERLSKQDKAVGGFRKERYSFLSLSQCPSVHFSVLTLDTPRNIMLWSFYSFFVWEGSMANCGSGDHFRSNVLASVRDEKSGPAR